MSKHEDLWERLDTEFDHLLLDMKPFVLKHPSKTERQCCAIWIKKLCDPTICGSVLMDRKNRNMYARLMLCMLKRGNLEAPFTTKPEPGKLKTLPAYMSIYFDEPVSSRRMEQSNRGLPHWVTGELSSLTEESLTMDLKNQPSSTPIAAHHRSVPKKLYMFVDVFSSIFGSNSITEQQMQWKTIMTRCFLCSQTEMKIKVLEAKHQEEKLKMQQRHDADVEKILDRKNHEIEEIKSVYRAKQKESEEMIRSLEKKVQSVLRESQVICESKEKRIVELKKISDQSAESIKNEWEKKFHAAVAEMEQEKFEMQKKHTESIQELLDDTNRRLAKMESEHKARSQATEQRVQEMELRVKQQSVEMEKGNELRQTVTQEKARLELHVASLSAELQEANKRIVMLQKEKEQQSDQHEENVMRLQAKHETDISHLHQEHALSAAKASEIIEDLEKNVAQFKQQLQESEYRRHQQVRDQEMKFQQEKDELQASCDKKVARTSSSDDFFTLLEMESQLDRARQSQRQQIQQADLALEQFKKQVELSSEKAYADMKLQMEKVEEDLIRSKTLREKQAKEFSQQLDALRQKYEQQVCIKLGLSHEQERMRLQQQHSAEKENLVQEHQREAGSLERQARATLQQHQQHAEEWRKRDAQTISDLEAQVSSLHEELQKVHALHKQKLAEMALLQEEERQTAALNKEASMHQLRSDMERIAKDLKRSHQQEMDATLKKVNKGAESKGKKTLKSSIVSQLIQHKQGVNCTRERGPSTICVWINSEQSVRMKPHWKEIEISNFFLK
uniref:Centrosomal protein 112 n=1 Tax=Cyprinodon variegatus TaxID=28743 RepID=A0A3Q2EFW2_CYPVA